MPKTPQSPDARALSAFAASEVIVSETDSIVAVAVFEMNKYIA
jgi:hypothetical protein